MPQGQEHQPSRQRVRHHLGHYQHHRPLDYSEPSPPGLYANYHQQQPQHEHQEQLQYQQHPYPSLDHFDHRDEGVRENEDPTLGHESCIETLAQLERDLAEMQDRYDVLQTEQRNEERSLKAILRRQDEEIKRLAVIEHQLKEVAIAFDNNEENNNMERHQQAIAPKPSIVQSKDSLQADLETVTEMLTQIMAAITNNDKPTMKHPFNAKATSIPSTCKNRDREHGAIEASSPKTQLSSASSILLFSSTATIPSHMTAATEGSSSLKTTYGQKCHAALQQLYSIFQCRPQQPEKDGQLCQHDLHPLSKGNDYIQSIETFKSRQAKRPSGCSATSSSGETVVGTMMPMSEPQQHLTTAALETQRLLDQQHARHQAEIEQIKLQCMALYRESLRDLRVELKAKFSIPAS
ncbi:hypothetical protein BGZ94_007845 [Podila epigama]|nr:hypothetical protein BGZ94_007845 [Podila epigama]